MNIVKINVGCSRGEAVYPMAYLSKVPKVGGGILEPDGKNESGMNGEVTSCRSATCSFEYRLLGGVIDCV